MKVMFRQFEVAFIFVITLIYFAFLWTPKVYFAGGSVGSKLEDSDPYATAANIALVAFLVIGGILRRRELIRALGHGWPILAVLGLAFVSAFWSDAPFLVIRRSGVLALSTLLAFYIVVRLELAELVKLLVTAFVVIGIASFAIVAVAPAHGLGGVASAPHAWRGAFTQKNILGSVASLGAIVCAYAFFNRHGSRLQSGFGFLLTVSLTILSESKTTLLVWPAAVLGVAFASSLRRRDGLGILAAYIVLLICISAGAYSYAHIDAVLAVIGRNPDFSGRLQLWEDAVYYIGLRPWLGYGFGAFWRSDSFEANQIWATVTWEPPQAHNGWLELGLNLGFLGIAGVAALWTVFIFRLTRLLVVPEAKHTIFCLLIFASSAVVNLGEASLLRQGDNMWILFVIAFVHLKRETLALRRGVSARQALPLPVKMQPIIEPG